jgi:hypothetical protein
MKQQLSRTVFQATLIVVLSSALALAVNSVRARGLDLSRNYFELTRPAAVHAQPDKSPSFEMRNVSDADSVSGADAALGESDSNAAAAEMAVTGGNAGPAPYPVGELGFREITTPQVLDLLNDPRAESMAVLFVDARNEEFYNSGHIPRAVQLDHYYADQYMPDVLPLAMAAELLVVYCGGGDCEDSMMVCNDLMLEGVPQENILLYKEGMDRCRSSAGAPHR